MPCDILWFLDLLLPLLPTNEFAYEMLNVGIVWENAVVTLSRHFSGGGMENYEYLQSGLPVPHS